MAGVRLLLVLGAAVASMCCVEGSRIVGTGQAMQGTYSASVLGASGIVKAGRGTSPIISRHVAPAMHLRGGKAGKLKNDEYAEFTAPKKALSAYMLFANDIRSKVSEENPDLKMTQLSAKIGEAWKNISADDKAKYDGLAEKAKKKHEKDKAEYEAKVPVTVRMERDQAKKSAKKAQLKRANKDPNMPKKPASAFMVFAVKTRSQVKEKHPDLSFGDLTKKVAEQWNAMNDEQKEPYNKEAAIAKEKHLAEMAKYKANKAKEDPPAAPEKKSKKKKDAK